MALSALAGATGAMAVALSPMGTLGGNFDCYAQRQFLSAVAAGGFQQERVGEAGGGERFILWEDLTGQFIITMEMPGMAAVCIVSQGKYKKPVGV